MARPLDPDEAALWARVAETIRPLHRRPRAPAAAEPIAGAQVPIPRARSQPPAVPPRKPAPHPADATLDGGWDRKLSRGSAAPDRVVDLHGFTLAAAHAELETRLEEARIDHARVVLVITGRGSRGPGLIRQSLPDWIAHSVHRGAIAAVRPAHPRHGGAGAFYVVLRRVRDG